MRAVSVLRRVADSRVLAVCLVAATVVFLGSLAWA